MGLSAEGCVEFDWYTKKKKIDFDMHYVQSSSFGGTWKYQIRV